MDRRQFMMLGGVAMAVPILQSCIHHRLPAARPSGQVMTVNGSMPSSDLGITLVHEHLFADLRSFSEQSSQPLTIDTAGVAEVVLPYLAQLQAAGCRTLVDLTATHLGRKAGLLRKLSEASGLNILTVCGVYLSADGRFTPDYARSDTVEQLARRWIIEWERGIDGTGVRPGVMKLGVNGGQLTALETKALSAAALTHLRTGLPIVVHTGAWRPAAPEENARSAMAQLDLLAAAGVSASAWTWAHAQNEPVRTHHLAAARRGAFISFDGYRPGREAEYIGLVENLRAAGLLGQVLLSQDAGWYTAGEVGGGAFTPYHPIFTDLLPALRRAGFEDREVATIFVDNPARALAIRPRQV